MSDIGSDSGRLPWERPGRFDATREAAQRAAAPGAPQIPPRTSEALFELCPPGYRDHEVLRRHPRILARMARHHVAAELDAARAGYSDARRELRDRVPPHVVEQMLATYRAMGEEWHRAADRVARIERAILTATPPETSTRTRPGRARGTIETMDAPQAHEPAAEPRWIPDAVFAAFLGDDRVTGDLAALQTVVTDERIYQHAGPAGDVATG